MSNVMTSLIDTLFDEAWTEWEGVTFAGPSASKVINKERRSRRDVNRPPFSYICCIEGRRRRGNPVILGTGTLIAPRTVLTAAHVLVHPRTGVPADASRLRIIPGRVSRDEPFGSSPARNGGVIPNPTFNVALYKFTQQDFGIIQLAKTLGSRKKAGYWGERRRQKVDPRGSVVSVLPWTAGMYSVNHSGYPREGGGFQRSWYAQTVPSVPGTLSMASTCEKSVSDNPVWVTRHRSLGGRHLMGIVVGQDPFTSSPECFAIIIGRRM